MVVNKFLRIFYDKRVKPESLYERKVLLWAAFKKRSKYKPDETYYQLFLETDTKEKVNCFVGGSAIVEKLDSIDHLTLPTPTPIELVRHSIDGSAKFNDIIFLDLDGLAKVLQERYK